MDTLMKTYNINKIGSSEYHLGCDYLQSNGKMAKLSGKLAAQHMLKNA